MEALIYSSLRRLHGEGEVVTTGIARVERLAWAMQEVEQRMEQLPRNNVTRQSAG